MGHEQPTLLYLAIFGSIISYIYSAPPLKLKQWGWAGNYALGSSYIALPWWAGQVRGWVGGRAGNYALGSSYIALPWWAGQVRGWVGGQLCTGIVLH